MTWKRDTRPENVRKIGPFTVWSETNTDRETCHVIEFPDGSELRVLPNGESGHRRAQQVGAVCRALAGDSVRLGDDLAYLVAVGGLAEQGLEWEKVEEVEVCGECGRPL